MARRSRSRRLARPNGNHDRRGNELGRVMENTAGEAAAELFRLHAPPRLDRGAPRAIALAQAFGADLDVVAGVDWLEELGLFVGRQIAVGPVRADADFRCA